MDQDRVLAVFLHVIDYFMQWICATKHCLLVIEFGFQQPHFFQTNIGKDFINKVYVRCCSNDLINYKMTDSNVIEKPFVLNERLYRYNMTPFDLRYRLFHLSELVEHKHHYILKEGDCYITVPHNIIVFFNESTGRLGISCDIEAARTNYKKENNNNTLSDFFLLHQCCLIVRDLCEMIESCIHDIDTSIIPLQQAVPHVCSSSMC